MQPDEIMVKRDGNLVRAKFTVNDKIRKILLDYAGQPGEPTYQAILHKVVIPLEGTDSAKKDLRDTVVFFPETAEGFINLTPWVHYLSTARVTTTSIASSRSSPTKFPAASKSKSSRSAEHIFTNAPQLLILADSGTKKSSSNFDELFLYEK